METNIVFQPAVILSHGETGETICVVMGEPSEEVVEQFNKEFCEANGLREVPPYVDPVGLADCVGKGVAGSGSQV
jgi:hypothetical protein